MLICYLDTEGTFRPERIAQIAERFGVDPETGMQLSDFVSLRHTHPMQHRRTSRMLVRSILNISWNFSTRSPNSS